MRLQLIIITPVVCVLASVPVSAQPVRQHSWNEVKKAAKACSMEVHRAALPARLLNSPNWTYYFDRQSTSAQRICVYERLNIGYVERVLRESDFADAKRPGS